MLIIREFRFTSRKGHKGLGRREHDSKEHNSKGLRLSWCWKEWRNLEIWEQFSGAPMRQGPMR